MPVFVLYIGENGKVTETSGKKMSQEIISSSTIPTARMSLNLNFNNLLYHANNNWT